MANPDGFDADDDRDEPGDELKEILRELLQGGGGFDPAKLAGVAGLPSDPAAVQALLANMQAALARQGEGLDWQQTLQQARSVAAPGNREVSADERERYLQAFRLAELWLSEVTELGEVRQLPRTFTRLEWIAASQPLWSQLAEPVATGIADTLVKVLTEQTPPELQSFVAQSNTLMRNLGGAMFTLQLGQAVGQLAAEVVSGGDIGVPVLPDEHPTLLPQNVAEFAEGLDVDPGQVELYLAVRELAHVRLFTHARWLRLHLLSAVTAFAKGITIDTGRIEQLVRDLDPQDPQAIREALQSGAFIPPRSPEQQAALDRLETVLALIEGWVDAVTEQATGRLPRAEAIAEAVRRRRAHGGPAERAFGTLLGLELRPRRLREAAALWRAVRDAHGAAARDALWDHFDALPTSQDIDEPQVLIARLGFGQRVDDPLDQELASLLADPSAFGQAPSGGEDDGTDRGPKGGGKPGPA